MKLQVYADASYADNYYKSSQLQYLIFLTPGSKLGSEVLAFEDLFLMAFSMENYLQVKIGNAITLFLITYSFSLFDVQTKVTMTMENILMIYLRAVN